MKSSGVSIVLLVIAALVSLAMIVLGFVGTEEGPDRELINFGMLALVVVACAASIVLGKSEPAQAPPQEHGNADVVEHLMLVQQSLDRMSQHAALSDDARRVLNRTRERELLNKAIEEDIRSQDWSAAQVLVTELASRFGYEQDAERFRMRIERARAEGLDKEINDAIKALDHLIVQRHWDEALQKADNIAAGFPVSPRVKGLRDRVVNAREQYKQEIERRFLLAAQAERVDEAMEILTELDHYLSEQEAEPFREVARGVIGKARQNLGAAFKLACQDRHWSMAVSLGQQINEQFPNSRMAQEVEGLMPQLRQRAQEEPDR